MHAFAVSQLESELTALTEESNARLTELSKTIDDIRADHNRLEEILQAQLKPTDTNSIEVLQQNEMYLRHELQKSLSAYTELHEQLDSLNKRMMDIVKKNKILSNRLRENGIDDSIVLKEQHNELAAIKKKTQIYQGMFKYNNKDTTKILQRLIVELTPRVAITLLPGLPAYIVMMCIRWVKYYGFCSICIRCMCRLKETMPDCSNKSWQVTTEII